MTSSVKQEEPIPRKEGNKKRRIDEQIKLSEIPTSSHYHVSYMHREIVTHAVCSMKHGYVVTASQDGVVKFWKRKAIHSSEKEEPSEENSGSCLEFVKSFTAHAGAVTSMEVSHEGDTIVSLGVDYMLKIYDVSTFDVTGMIQTNNCQGPIALLGQQYIAAGSNEKEISIFSLSTLSSVKTIQIHAAPVTSMVYNDIYQCVMSSDRKGMIELWASDEVNLASAKVKGLQYDSKPKTDLYELFKKKTFALALATCGSHYAMYCQDHKVRILHHGTGKMVIRYDERPKVYDKTFSSAYGMDALEYGKRAATEREMADESPIFGEKQEGDQLYQSISLAFDSTGRFLLVPSMVGIKVIDWSRHKVVKIVGKLDASFLRIINICLCEGGAKINQQMQLARVGGSSIAMNHEAMATKSDALLIALAYQKRRFYVFSHKDPLADEEEDDENINDLAARRDILNEPPTAEDRLLDTTSTQKDAKNKVASEAVLRTSMGDIHFKLFSKEVPRTIENFVGHAQNGYYDNVIFHRVIKGFMIQTGDPLGDGTGGESIWGGEFEDEFVRELRHDRPFTVSMANAGPNTNGSQFFITCCPTPWLDQKHTVFGRVTKGMDICTEIERIETDHHDKPVNEISILSVDIN
mmetsp:Transcript_30995/g.45822  ORF Transcript_30995/g.45822 Transcript_30995/m.45822 type:complete len:635 (-) Transcript_30995:517-2421(-)